MTPTWHLGYNSNGFAHHRIEDAIDVLRDIGYESVAVTLDHDLLDPPDQRGVAGCLARLRPALERNGMRVTIETGARYILDPRRKHQPTLISGNADGQDRRLAMLRAAVDVAEAVSADSVSLWSGRAADDAPRDVLTDRLVAGLRRLLDYADARSVRLAFEPEPGMLIQTMAQYADLASRLDHPSFGLTLDLGHVHCLDDGTPGEHIRRWQERLWNIHIEDMCQGVHEHLEFGRGAMAFLPIFTALGEVGYTGPIHVELPRQAHDAVDVATRSYQFLADQTARVQRRD